MRDATFPTQSPVTLRDMLKPEVRNRPVPAKAKLFLPEHRERPAAGWPAIVLLEGLGGLKPERELAYGRDLAEDGYAVLVIDTFATRDAARLSDTQRALTVSEAMMLADAFAGLRYLRSHGEIDPDRIAVMGFSYGGMVTVLAAYEQMRRLMAPDLPGFAAHASYYGCSVPRLDDPTTTGAPVVIQIGDKDKNVSVARTRQIADDLVRGGSPVELVVHDAWHQWDGKDVTRRFVRWTLEELRIRVDRDSRAALEGPVPLRMTGPFTRRMMIAAGVRPTGYHILRDEKVETESYRTLLRFLAESMPAKRAATVSPAPAAVRAGAAERRATG